MDSIIEIRPSVCWNGTDTPETCTVVVFRNSILICSVCGDRDYSPNLRIKQ
jgi:hypothetical protein